jgi:hypothetical protein
MRGTARPACSVHILTFPANESTAVSVSAYRLSSRVLVRRYAASVALSRPVHGGLGDDQQHTRVCSAVHAASPGSTAPGTG